MLELVKRKLRKRQSDFLFFSMRPTFLHANKPQSRGSADEKGSEAKERDGASEAKAVKMSVIFRKRKFYGCFSAFYAFAMHANCETNKKYFEISPFFHSLPFPHLQAFDNEICQREICARLVPFIAWCRLCPAK